MAPDGLRVVDSNAWDEFLVQAPGRTGATPTPKGATPPTFTGEEQSVAEAYRRWFDTSTVDAIASKTEGGDGLRDTIKSMQSSARSGPYSVEVNAVRLVGSDHALVNFSIFTGGTALPDQQGAAVRVKGRWVVSRATFCAVVPLIGVECPSA